MSRTATISTPEYFQSFGDLLKHLRLRSQLTQRELAIALGYNHAHLSRLEHNQRLPDVATVLALFVPALSLEDEPEWATRLVALAAAGRGEPGPRQLTVTQTVTQVIEEEELGVLESVPALPAHAVPRRAALAQLRRRLETERCVAVCGMAGMGKTTLGAALARDWTPGEPVFWFTFTPGLAALVETLLRQLALFLVAQGQEQLLPVVRAGAGRERSLPLDQQLAHISAALAQVPALLCLDDVHVAEADAAWLGVLRRLARQGGQARLLLLSRAAPPVPGLALVQLGGLEPDEARALVAEARVGLAPELVQRLLSKTAASPMLLRLALGELQHGPRTGADYIDRLENEPQVTRYLLSTWLRDLPPPAEKLLALLSVFRQPVDVYDEQLVELSQQADGAYDLGAGLAELQRRQIVDHPNQAGLHPLVRDFVYAALVGDVRRRRALHQAAARWFEQARDDVLEASAHYQRAGDLRQAVEVLADRGHSLISRGQALAAAAQVEALLAAMHSHRRREADSDLRRQLLTVHGDVLLNSVRLAEAEASYRQALALAEAQPVVWASLAARLTQCIIQGGRMAEALALGEQVAARLAAEAKPPTVLLAELAAVTCRAQMNLSRYAEAEATARQALALADECAPYAPRAADAVRARAKRALGWLTYTRQPDPEGGSAAALALYQQARAAAYRAEVNWVANACSINIAILQYERGELAAARASFNEAWQQAQAVADDHLATSAEHNLAGLDYLRGDTAAALAHTQAVIAAYERIDNQSELAAAREQLAAIYIASGQFGQARAALDQTRRYHAQNTAGSPRDRGYCLATLVELLVLEGDGPAALATAREALQLPGLEDDARLRVALENGLALALLTTGDVRGAVAVVGGKSPAEVGLEVGIMRQLVSGVVALASGDVARASQLAAAVTERIEATGCEVYRGAAGRLAAAARHPVATEQLPRLLWGEAMD